MAREDLPGATALGETETRKRLLNRALDDLEEGMMTEAEFQVYTGMTPSEARKAVR